MRVYSGGGGGPYTPGSYVKVNIELKLIGKKAGLASGLNGLMLIQILDHINVAKSTQMIMQGQHI